MRPKPGRIAYSSESAVPRLGSKADAPARREPAASRPPAAQSPRVRREKGGRGGRTVTVAGPLVLARPEAETLLTAWKKVCGGGGALKEAETPDGSPAFELEVQGDHAERLLAELLRAGYKAKRAGG